MAVSHVKSLTMSDWTGTVTVGNSNGATLTIAATDLFRPSDCNSAHNEFRSLGGNTLGSSTASGTNLSYFGSGAVSLKGSSDSIVWSSPVMSTYEAFPFVAGAGSTTIAFGPATSGQVSFVPFYVHHPLSAGILDIVLSMSLTTVGTSSGRQTCGLHFGIYQRGAGANSTRLESITTTKWEVKITGNNSSYSFNHPTTTNYTGYGTGDTNSAGSNITSGYTGLKKIGIPINSYLSPGQYWYANIASNSTSSVNVGISYSIYGMQLANPMSQFGPVGSFSSAYSTGSDMNAQWREGHGSWSSAGSVTGLPASVAFNSITRALFNYPAMRFWST